jgi:hypothetical protein
MTDGVLSLIGVGEILARELDVDVARLYFVTRQVGDVQASLDTEGLTVFMLCHRYCREGKWSPAIRFRR